MDSLQDKVLTWVHGVVIADENNDLRAPSAADVARQFGITLAQAQAIMRSDTYSGKSPAEQAWITQNAIDIRRKGLMSAADAARFLGISERTVRRYVAEGCPSWRDPCARGGWGTLLVRFLDVHHWRDQDPLRYLETPDMEDARPIPYDSPPRGRRRHR